MPVSARVTWMEASRYPCPATLTDVTKPSDQATQTVQRETLPACDLIHKSHCPSLVRRLVAQTISLSRLSIVYDNILNSQVSLPFSSSRVGYSWETDDSIILLLGSHHHHVVPQVRISLILSRHFSQSFIASGRYSGPHPVVFRLGWVYLPVSLCHRRSRRR